MEISLGIIQQKDLDYAIACLEDCKKQNAKEYGFNYPYFAPGGAYGDQWWQLDSSLALSGYKWIDRKFAETSLRNFIESQKEDGRICLWGADTLPSGVAGGDFPEQTDNVSSLPKIFEVAYQIVYASLDLSLVEDTYKMLKKYIDWWFSNRFDCDSGLITAVFEETFIPYLGKSGKYAPVDTNTEVYIGCHYTQLLAERLKLYSDAELLKARKESLKIAINEFLWDENAGAYFPYDTIKKEKINRLTATTFCPLRMRIANKEQHKKLIKLLTDHKHFNWDTIPLTSVSKQDEIFTVTTGVYKGNASWSGNVWSLINEAVICGLSEYGDNDLAAELALKTLFAFKSNCTEFVNPFDGSGHGVLKYAWTASQYIKIITEIIFGLNFNQEKSEVYISPTLNSDLKKTSIFLKNVCLTQNQYIDIEINCGKVSYKTSTPALKVFVQQ